MNNELMFSSARISSGSDEWQTPKWLFDYLNQTYKFTLDAAASDSNHLCDEYFTQEQDALKQTWNGRAWLNCPYSLAKPFMQKAFNSCKEGSLELAVCLIPARTETTFWQDYVDKRALQVFFLRGRLAFVRTRAELEKAADKWFASDLKKNPRLGISKEEYEAKIIEIGNQGAPFPSALVVYHRDAFKLGTTGKTQYSCLDLRTATPKKPRVPKVQKIESIEVVPAEAPAP